MLCVTTLPHRLKIVSPISLGILKALTNDLVDSRTLDLSIKYQDEYIKILLSKMKRVSLHHENLAHWLMHKYPILVLYNGPLDEVDHKLENLAEKILSDILSYDPDIVAFSTSSTNLSLTLMVSQELSRNNVKVICGGPAILWKSNYFANVFPPVHCFVEGEAETVFRSLVARMLRGYKVERAVQAPMLFNLNDSPIPDYDGLDLHPYEMIGVETQRGCPNKCVFCCNRFSQLTENYRAKSIERVGQEVEKLSCFEKPFYFCDNITNVSKQRIIALCKVLTPLEIKWAAEMIPKISFEEAVSMARSGCFLVSLGCESLSDGVLKKMEKPITVKLIRETLQNLSINNIKTNVMLIKGFPGETALDAFKTWLHIITLYRFISSLIISEFTLVQNSRIYQHPERYGIEKLVDVGIYQHPERYGIEKLVDVGSPFFGADFRRRKTLITKTIYEIGEAQFHGLRNEG